MAGHARSTRDRCAVRRPLGIATTRGAHRGGRARAGRCGVSCARRGRGLRLGPVAIRSGLAGTRGRAGPLALLQDLLPSHAAIRGDLEFDAEAKADAAGLITGGADVQLNEGAITQAFLKREDSIDVAFRGGRVSGRLDSEALQIIAAFALEQGGAIAGEVHALRSGLPAPIGGGDTGNAGNAGNAGVLNGRLTANDKKKNKLPLFIPAIENTRGQFNISLGLQGAWDEPQLTGEVTLALASAVLPAYGLKLADIGATLRAHDRGHVSLEASVRSGAGTLSLRGDAQRQANGDWLTRASAKGERVEIMHTAEMHIIASPDIQMTLLRNRIDLPGEIVIPEALIQPRELRGAVSESDDVIIMSSGGEPIAQSRWQIYTQLRVRLGDFVRFNGFGLRTRSCV